MVIKKRSDHGEKGLSKGSGKRGAGRSISLSRGLSKDLVPRGRPNLRLQQLSQQLVNHQQMFQQSLEMQRQQSQALMETLTTLGAAQVAKTTYDARDFQTKAFSKMKGFEGDRKLGQIGGTSFVLKLRGASVKQLRSW